MISRTTIAVAASAGACALALGVTAPAMAAPEQAQDKAMVSVFHGIPGMTVDVYANGDQLLSDFEPGTVTDPQSLDAGTYDIEIFEAGQGPDGTPALEKQVKVPEGGNATVAAHLSATGGPQLTAFTNDVSKVDAGKARLTVRHVAAAPAVDVRAGEQPLFTGLVNPDEDTASVDAGTVNADVVLAGTDTVAIGPADLDLKEGTSNVVYAWGSADDKNLALATQTFSGMQTMPKAVHAGGNGAAVTPNSSDQWPAWAAVAGAITVTGALVVRRTVGRRG
ncbi:lipoprotein [Streptomyces malachitofuscus]|nr:lipoprotein [Streptomyces malachitofuscus]